MYQESHVSADLSLDYAIGLAASDEAATQLLGVMPCLLAMAIHPTNKQQSSAPAKLISQADMLDVAEHLRFGDPKTEHLARLK